jgi:hypothetical protein
MAFFVRIVMIVCTSIHCTGPPSIYSSSPVDSFISSPYHRCQLHPSSFPPGESEQPKDSRLDKQQQKHGQGVNLKAARRRASSSHDTAKELCCWGNRRVTTPSLGSSTYHRDLSSLPALRISFSFNYLDLYFAGSLGSPA